MTEQIPTRSLFRSRCKDCGRKSWFAAVYDGGWITTCLRCGRNWRDGEWMPLDFVRQSRQKSIAVAKRRWRETAVSEEE